MTKRDYEDRQAARRERFLDCAEKAEDRARQTSTYPSPFGAPGIRMLETRLAGPLTDSVRPRVVFMTPSDVASVLDELVGDADREHFVALYVNSRHEVTHAHVVSRGAVATAPVHPREVFKGAILANATALVVGHNHPSGDVRPSEDDKRITERLREAGCLLGIELLDALIVGPGGKFYSASDDRVSVLPARLALEVADGSR